MCACAFVKIGRRVCSFAFICIHLAPGKRVFVCTQKELNARNALAFSFFGVRFFFSAIVKFFISRTNVPNESIGLLLSRY